MNQKRAYKSYPKAFKEEAVALVTDQGYWVSEAANSLGIRANQLYEWKAKIDATKQDGALSGDERS
jgi:transposase